MKGTLDPRIFLRAVLCLLVVGLLLVPAGCAPTSTLASTLLPTDTPTEPTMTPTPEPTFTLEPTGRTAAEELLVQAREGLHQEWVHLQVLGRALTDQEKQRSDALQEAVSLVDEALAVLGCGDVP